MRRLRAIFSVVLIALSVSMPLKAHAQASGWNLVHERDPAASEIRFQWVIRSGSLDDSLDRSGLAHFTARALFRGTTTRPYDDLTRAFQALSATVAIETTHEFTRFHFRLPVARWDAFLHLIRDVFSNPEFEPIQVDRLRSDLLAEARALRADSRTVASQEALAQFYAGTSARNPPSGTATGLSRISARDIRQFYRAHYGVSNTVLGVVSPWEESVVLAKLNQLLRGVPEVISSPRALPSPSAQGVSAVVISDPSVLDAPFQVVLPGVAPSDFDRPGLELANRAFGVGPDSRLAQFAPNLNGWLTWASSGFDQLIPPSTGVGVYSIIGTSSNQYASDVIPATVELFQQFLAGGISDYEFIQVRDEQLAAVNGAMGSAIKRLEMRLSASLSGSPYLDLAGWQAELGRWDSKRVSSRMQTRLAFIPVVVVAIGDPAVLVPILKAIPGMGDVRTLPR